MNIYHDKFNISFFINFKIIKIMLINYSSKDSFDKMITIFTILTYNHQLLNMKIVLLTSEIKMNLIFNNFYNNHYVKIIICKIFILCLT